MKKKTISMAFKVEAGQTADAVGSGTLPVLATPMLIAYLEHTAMQLLSEQLKKGETSVGSHIEISHLKPSPVGDGVACKAMIVNQEGRKVEFELVAYNLKGDMIGCGKHTRFIVDAEKFMSKVTTSNK